MVHLFVIFYTCSGRLDGADVKNSYVSHLFRQFLRILDFPYTKNYNIPEKQGGLHRWKKALKL